MKRAMTAMVTALGLSVGVFAQTGVLEEVKCLPDDLFANLEHKVLYLPEAAAAPAPVVDGELNDAIWKQAAHVTDFSDQHTAGKPHDPIEAWVARGTNAIYVAIKGGVQIPAYPQGRVQSQSLHYEDFRVLFNPDPARWGRNEFAVGGTGMEWIKGVAATNISHLKDYLYPAWNPEVKARGICARRGDSAIVEMIVPFATLGVPAPERGAEWAFDLSRQHSFEWPIPNSKQYGRQHSDAIWGGFHGASHAQLDRWGRMYFGTAQEREAAFRAPIVRAYMDRARYDDSDESGEGFIEILPGSDALTTMTLATELVDAKGVAVAQSKVEKLESGAIGLFINPRPLPQGKYEVVGRVSTAGKPIAEARCPFERIAGTAAPAAPMKEIPINLFPDTRLGSTSLPVSVGVPFPKGLLKDTSALVLQEALGPQWGPTWHSIPAQFDVRARWYRNGSLEWVGVSFEAQYLQGTARSYRLLWQGAEEKARIEKPLTTEETGDAIAITTGPAKFTILKKGFNLVDSAWLDADGDGKFGEKELLVKAGSEGGVWYENTTERLNGAHTDTVVRVVEAGPERAVVCAEGWYEGDGRKECMQKTRLFFTRGSKTVKVLHTWINTVDTRNGGRTREISLKLGVPNVKHYAFGSECGGIYSGDVPRKGIYQIQLSSEKCLIETEIGKAVGDDVRRMGGWVFAGNEHGGVSLAGRDMWRLYPKEVGVSPTGLGLYLWPAHGREVFSEEEQLKIPRLMQLLSAHQGREMDLQMPKSYYEKLGWYWNRDWEAEKDPRPTSFGPYISYKMWRGYNATGQGVATSVEVDMTLHGTSEGAPAARRCAEVLDINPSGVADPKWTRFTDTLGPLHEKDKRRFAAIEFMMDSRFQAWLDQMDRLDDYGMFNWPDLHQYPYDEFGSFGPPALAFHRCWSNNHYQESRTFFHMYLRSGEGQYWRYATERARHTMDVDSVNYADDPPVHPYHVRGANYHPKGLLHWGGDGSVSVHYSNYDYMLYHYYLTGDPRGPELAKIWAEEFARGVWVAEATRECSAPMAEITYAYHHFRDPRLLKALNLFKEATLMAPIAEHVLPWFNSLSWLRMHRYVNDPRVEALIAAHWNDGSPRKDDFDRPIIQSLAFTFTGDRRILAGARPGVCWTSGRFLCPPTESIFWGETPYLMSAYEQVGAPGDVMLSGPGDAVWEDFWKPDLEKWRAEGKMLYSRKP